jgi:lambda family phage portal protein
MTLLNNIGAYTEASIVNARIGASKMGFYKSNDDFSAITDTIDSEGEFIQEAEPGIFGKLPAGWDFQPFNPDYPRGEFPEFNKAMLRGTASGLLMAYSSISSDLSDVNFSSIRSGKIDERDIYRFIQRWFIQKRPEKIFQQWLDMSLMTGAIPLPYSKFEKFNAATWHARGFDWVDPRNDIEADIIAINFGLKTRAEVAASRGKDLRDIFEQLKREKELAEEYGLVFSSGKTEAAEKEKQGANIAKQGGSTDEED